jgi:serine/threonine protein kinase
LILVSNKIAEMHACCVCRLSSQPYTVTDVLRWTLQLATALDCLASLKHEPVVHGDIKPENILVEASTGNLVLGDYGVAMWQGRKTGLRLAPWLLSPNAFVAPERRLAILGPNSELSEDDKARVHDELLKEIGGGKLDIWSLGVVVYLLGMRQSPLGYTEEDAKIVEVDAVARLADAKEWIRTLRGVWSEAEDRELELLAKVITGSLQGLDRRLSAKGVLELLGPIGENHTHFQWLKAR